MSEAAIASVPAEAATPGGRKNPATLFLIIGVIGLIVALFGLVTGLQGGSGRAGLSWLLGFSFWFAALVGMLFLVQLSYVFDAGWSTIVRRQMEHFLGAFPILFLLLVPVIALPFFVGDNPGMVWKWLNLDNVLPGVHPTRVGDDPLYLSKAAFLNETSLIIGLVVSFVIFCGLSFVLRKNSFTNDFQPDAKHYANCRKCSGAGLFLTPIATTIMVMFLMLFAFGVCIPLAST